MRLLSRTLVKAGWGSRSDVHLDASRRVIVAGTVSWSDPLEQRAGARRWTGVQLTNGVPNDSVRAANIGLERLEAARGRDESGFCPDESLDREQ